MQKGKQITKRIEVLPIEIRVACLVNGLRQFLQQRFSSLGAVVWFKERLARYKIELLKKQARRIAERKRIETLAHRLLEELDQPELNQ